MIKLIAIKINRKVLRIMMFSYKSNPVTIAFFIHYDKTQIIKVFNNVLILLDFIRI